MVDRLRAQVLSELVQNAGPQAQELEFNAWFLGLDDEVYYSVVHDAWDQVFISGPYRAEGDFVFEAKGRYDYVQDSFPGNRYGILVSREKVDPRDPHSVHGHCLYVEINPRSDGGFDAAGWGVKEWYRTNWRGDDNGDEDQTVKGPGTYGAIHSQVGSWNTFRIERQGTKLHFWINNVYFGNVPNVDPGPVYVGLFARHTGSGSTDLSYDVLFEWDDVAVVALSPSELHRLYLPGVLYRPWDAYHEDNDHWLAAYGPLVSEHVYLAFPDDTEDYYYFELLTDSIVQVSLEDYEPTSDNGTVMLYGPAIGDECGDPIDYYSLRGRSSMSLGPHSLGPGKYYVRVRTARNHSSSQLYSLTVDCGTSARSTRERSP